LKAAATRFSAYVPELPGCIATGRSIDDATSQIREAIVEHVKSLRRARPNSWPEPDHPPLFASFEVA